MAVFKNREQFNFFQRKMTSNVKIENNQKKKKWKQYPLDSGCWDIQPFFRSSSIGGHLPFKHLWFWFVPPNLILESYQCLFRYSTFNILRSSSIGVCLRFEFIFIFVGSPELKFKIWEKSDHWLLRYSTFNILRSSSIGGCLPFKFYFFILVWSPELKFPI